MLPISFYFMQLNCQQSVKKPLSLVPVSISEYVDNRNAYVTSTDGTFQLPKEPGTHYYGAFVRWSSPQDSQISLGDTSFTFVVRVVEKK